jgi:RNA recognition motif-containing protein
MYVSNLSFQTTEEDLSNVFSQFGTVNSVKIINDRETGRSRGFGFVEMDVIGEAREAMAGLNQKELLGRAMNVDIAKERKENGFSKSRLW